MEEKVTGFSVKRHEYLALRDILLLHDINHSVEKIPGNLMIGNDNIRISIPQKYTQWFMAVRNGPTRNYTVAEVREVIEDLIASSDNGEWHSSGDCKVEERSGDCGLCLVLARARELISKMEAL